MTYPSAYIQELLARTDIYDLVSEDVCLKKMKYPGRWKGLCPFHTERTPSFIVLQDRQFARCHGCGHCWGPIRYVVIMRGLTYEETIRWLACRYHFYYKEWKRKNNRRKE